ncbi:squalene-associated FAD-dependent desaturase [Faunimonas pinastri]|uniref:Squalene-associated FAD-dependent desaturase n=1 Tax=Faunimonas pinastri TaxID=1855383 RepID=A0A1H9AID8_9HYPH|nr:hydroxysqualene dehydroxylase HpnE [Faunimonas pinastri]SEP76429.1 squalene-associated FAD-dependent desaturase [Faunimonas pinastri]
MVKKAATVHVIGAGLAGLSAAVALADAGRRVVLHEAARFAGGRCRSYHDPALGTVIDNGNHLLLSGNHAALAFLDRIGGRGALSRPLAAEFPFADLASGERWTLRPNDGRLPWWVLLANRRVPGTRVKDYLAPLGVLRARSGTIGEAMDCSGPLWDRLWRPLLLSALNTEPSEASAPMAAALLKETLGAGGKACRPLVATGHLGAAFVDPALVALRAKGAEIRFGARLRGLETDGEHVRALAFGDGAEELGAGDAAVLAVPAWVAAELLPGLTVPDRHHAIVNAHFLVPPPAGFPTILGVVNGLTEWLFAYPDRLSVTISGADRLLDVPREELGARIWREVATLTGLPGELPPWQVVRERRATFAATPEQEARRPAAQTRHRNLVLAGDWTATGLPATIEGSIRSGNTAANLLVKNSRAH